jgi:hypothetical protein
MDLGERGGGFKFLIRDRDTRFAEGFDAVFAGEDIRILTSPPRAPKSNAICERVIGELRRELLDRILIVNEEHLRRTLTAYLTHRNEARPHRALGQLTPAQAETGPPAPIDRPGRLPDPAKIHPRRTHPRVPDRGLTRVEAALEHRRPTPDSYFRAPQAPEDTESPGICATVTGLTIGQGVRATC